MYADVHTLFTTIVADKNNAIEENSIILFEHYCEFFNLI